MTSASGRMWRVGRVGAFALVIAACRPAASIEAPPIEGASAEASDEGAGAGEVAEAPPVVDEEAALPPAWVAAADKLAEAAKGDTTGWERLAEMADLFGHRLSGSLALERAIDWSLDQMRRDGLVNVRREKVMVPHWVRGEERARAIAPVERPLAILGLGGTVGTGKRPLRGEIMVVRDLDELRARAGEARGKIVVVNQPMPPFDHERHETHYGGTVQIRSNGAVEGARAGAKAVLIRSVTAVSLRSPHTGALRYADDVPKIPAAALSIEDAEFLARMGRRGPVEVELSLGAKTLPDAESGNAIGELRGRELPDEVVVIGGHIDSWDVGDGSSDDGGGCIMAIEALRLLQEAGLRPRRTIRAVLFTNEENGLRGGIAYHAAHGGERHVAAIEADVGAGAPWGFSISGSEAEVAAIQAYAPLLRRFGAGALFPGGGGADISPLTRDGVLSLGLVPDTSHYFDLHHSPADTVDKIDPEHLERNAAALAMMAYLLADR